MSQWAELAQKLRCLWPLLDERTRRLTAASEAVAIGYGGVSLVQRVCGLSRKAIAKGIQELASGSCPPAGRVRRAGAGRKPLTETDAGLVQALECLIDCGTRGDPESPLRWICKSTRTLAAELTRTHHPISYVKVAQLLHAQHYSLQSNRKTEEGRRSSAPRRAVSPHQRRREGRAGRRGAGHFGGHQEEGVGGQLRQRGPAMADRQAAAPGQWA